MRILILHPNFPAQFLRHCCFLGESRTDDIRFICHYHHDRHIAGVVKYKLKNRLGGDYLESLKLPAFEKVVFTGHQYFCAMSEFAKEGWIPDLILSHSGWGCGLFAKKVFPSARLISYLEWWFDSSVPADVSSSLNVNLNRNLAIGGELIEADLIVAPTYWQANQLPVSLKKRTKVLYDGVDLKRFSPSTGLKSVKPLVTYGTRGMEPTRGFPQFIRELPVLLNEFPDITVEIAGDDRVCYGPNKLPEGTYGSWAKQFLKVFVDNNRVKFLGTLAPSLYSQWLQKSWYHVYLTKPYVLSWSLVEAMASGCTLIASDTEPVREFLDDQSAILINMNSPGWLHHSISILIEDKNSNLYAKNARNLSLKLDEKKAWNSWYDTIVSVL